MSAKATRPPVGEAGDGSVELQPPQGFVGDRCKSGEAGFVTEEHNRVDMGCRDRGETMEFATEDRWANLVNELALVVHPEVACDGEQVMDAAAEDDNQPKFSRDEYLSTEEVSNWVLSRIHKVNQFLGVSFEGHEDKALKLFTAIEESWKEGAPVRQEVNPVKQTGRSARELRKLECSINYDQRKGGDGQGVRKGSGNQLLLQCG